MLRSMQVPSWQASIPSWQRDWLRYGWLVWLIELLGSFGQLRSLSGGVKYRSGLFREYLTWIVLNNEDAEGDEYYKVSHIYKNAIKN